MKKLSHNYQIETKDDNVKMRIHGIEMSMSREFALRLSESLERAASGAGDYEENYQLEKKKLECKVVSVSANRNSFGLSGVVVMARDGRAWELGVNTTGGSNSSVAAGFEFVIFIEDGSDVFPQAAFSYEIPRFLGAAPDNVIKEAWG